MVRLLEYQGKNLLKSFEIPTPEGEVASTSQEVRQIAQRLRLPAVIKAQITATGRFKAGGIGFADTPDEAAKVAGRILGSNIKGFVVRKVLVEEKLHVDREFYAGVIVDDSYKVRAPVLMFSTQGGVDIEQVAAEHPEAVGKIVVNPLEGLSLDAVENLIRSLGISSDLAGRLGKIAYGVYQVFRKYGARSVETNPIALTSDGTGYAVDCRIVLDESSASKYPELGIEFPRDIGRLPTDLERKAWKIEENDFRGVAYFIQMATEIKPGEGYVGFHGIGGGGAMLGADALVRHGLKLANYADTSGNPTASKVYRVAKIILSQPNIDGYILMGPVVANQEQWHHAHALVRALREEVADRRKFPVVILIAGNKESESIEILKHGLAGLSAQIEVYGRDHVYDVDFVAEQMKRLVDEYTRDRARNIDR
ncbi:MAG: ATP-grasp domain-containing protein [Candidatus Bathyarchaeia archaeon]